MLLLEKYKQHPHSFSDRTMKKQQAWDLIARDMNATKGVAHFTSNVCSKKFSNVEMRYKGKRDKMGKTGRGGGRWLYVDRMNELLGERASVKALSDTSQPLSHSKSTASVSTASACTLLSCLLPSSTSVSNSNLIGRPSESSDDEQHDKEAMKSVSQTCTKRR